MICSERAILIVGVIALLAACSPPKQEPKSVARAYDMSLSWDELMSAIPDNVSSEDSIRIAQSYINNWLREKVVLRQAELNLTDESKDFTRQLEDYRKSLLIYAFESQLVEQKLDTSLSETEIEAYYRNNQDNFQLKDYIVQARFCILENEPPKLNRFKKLFYSEDSLDIPELEEYCVENGARYFLEESQWLYFDELLKQVPMQVFDRESFLKKNKNISFEKDNKLFFLILKDYKLKDSVSPLSLERDNIRSILLNKRKLELLSNMRNDLFNEAIRKKEIQIVE